MPAPGAGPSRDVAAHFIQTTRLDVDGAPVGGGTGVRLFAGDMYQSLQNCSLVVSSTTQTDACGEPRARAQYACMPVRLYLFVLGPLACSAHGTAVLLLIKQYDNDEARWRSTAYFGVHAHASGTVRLRNGASFQLRGTSLELEFDADLPLRGPAGGCAQMSFTAAALQRQSGAGAAQAGTLLCNFDTALHHFLSDCSSGFYRMVDWSSLEQMGFMGSLCGSGAMLPRAAARHALLWGGTACTSASVTLDESYFLQCGAGAAADGDAKVMERVFGKDCRFNVTILLLAGLWEVIASTPVLATTYVDAGRAWRQTALVALVVFTLATILFKRTRLGVLSNLSVAGGLMLASMV